jgi:hypothetical protein
MNSNIRGLLLAVGMSLFVAYEFTIKIQLISCKRRPGEKKTNS